jgi:ABC-type nitrate/sulfonate/bicarbonate transport system substrate-binding protein
MREHPYRVDAKGRVFARLTLRTVLRAMGGLLLALTCTRPGEAQTRLTIGYGNLSSGVVPILTAAENGYFTRQGISPDLRLVRGGSLTTAALLSGQLRFAAVSLIQIVGPVSRGGDLVIVASLVDKMPYQLVVSPRIRSPKDLTDRRIGVVGLSGATYLAAHLALRPLGLEAKRDRIWLVSIGAEAERVAALLAGSIDAAIMTPNAAARLPAPPYRTLVDLRAGKPVWLHLGLVTTRRFVRDTPQLAEGVLRAVAEGAAFALDPGNREAVKAIIAKFEKLDDPVAIEDAYRDMLEDLAWKPIPDGKGAEAVLRTMAEFGVVQEAARLRPQDIIDPTLMLKLDREGWLDRILPRR